MNVREKYLSLRDELMSVTEDASFEALELLSFVTEESKERVLAGEGEVSGDADERLEKLLLSRKSGRPLQYLLGEWDFYGRPFYVGEGVLIPRADTETLAEAGLRWAKENTCRRAADLCSGSGCIAVTLQKELPSLSVIAVENSAAALCYLRKNVRRHKAAVMVLEESVLAPKAGVGELDLIVSNPPYLTKQDMETLQREVRFEPPEALYGGDDGLFFYREITRIWKDRLRKGGALFFEIGQGQEPEVETLLLQNGFGSICTERDACGIIRVISGIRK